MKHIFGSVEAIPKVEIEELLVSPATDEWEENEYESYDVYRTTDKKPVVHVYRYANEEKWTGCYETKRGEQKTIQQASLKGAIKKAWEAWQKEGNSL